MNIQDLRSKTKKLTAVNGGEVNRRFLCAGIHVEGSRLISLESDNLNASVLAINKQPSLKLTKYARCLASLLAPAL